jgi:hypothetical protein
MAGMNGTREIAADAAEAAAAGTRTGRPPSALATSATVTTPSPSPAMLYARRRRSCGRQCDRSRDVVVVDQLQWETRIRHDRLQHRHQLGQGTHRAGQLVPRHRVG